MKVWSVRDAKARFSEMLDACLRDGPQMVTRRGNDVAVLVPMREWQRLHEATRPSLKELLLRDQGRGDLPVPQRGRLRQRKNQVFGGVGL
jgi:antitoxin Phd